MSRRQQPPQGNKAAMLTCAGFIVIVVLVLWILATAPRVIGLF